MHIFHIHLSNYGRNTFGRIKDGTLGVRKISMFLQPCAKLIPAQVSCVPSELTSITLILTNHVRYIEHVDNFVTMMKMLIFLIKLYYLTLLTTYTMSMLGRMK